MKAAAPRIDPRARAVAERLLAAMFAGYLRTEVSGRENVPPEGIATLVVANHCSGLDVFAGGYAVHRTGFFLVKAEATRVRVLGRFLLAVGAIAAQRTGHDLGALKRMIAVLEDGRLLGVAPEGTRSVDGRIGPYDPGFVWLARRTGAVVVPCAIHGTWQLMPKGVTFPRRGPVWVAFGSAVDVGPRTGGMEESAALVRQVTLDLLGQLALRSGVPNPALTIENESDDLREPLGGDS